MTGTSPDPQRMAPRQTSAPESAAAPQHTSNGPGTGTPPHPPTGTAAAPPGPGAPGTAPSTSPPGPAPSLPPRGDEPSGTTSTAPTTRRVWFRARGIVLAALVLLAAAIVIALVRSDAQHGRLDPRSADPLGSHAVAALLAERGVSTRTVTTVAEAREATGPDTTLLVADPDLLTNRQQLQLRTAVTGSGGRTVLIAPSAASTGRLAPQVSADPALSIDSTLTPGCTFPAARRAGAADTGGLRYDTSSTSSPTGDSCYFSDGLPTLVRVPDAGTTGDTVVLGAPDILYNDRLDAQGNASLALQLLGSRPHLVWYLPSLSDPAAAPDTGSRSFYDLIPSGWLWGALEAAVAVALAALWRARRLGPLVRERLPVAIRASEAAEGRARLYRKADARDRAADSLRTATRNRLAPLIGTPPAHAHSPEVLLPALAARLARAERPAGPPAPPGAPERERNLHALLFGPPPRDDAALIALADNLDALEGEVRHS
ncbi:DUF4350 domain-containing protein [Streptomyces sp. TS71-3]|uniref:DUF4350 domain-containing protein n=1 Tax=Streptomyces sp. TS71-3 TaxID=2733862 RepID=UPI001B10CA31|nr:DUF4350 domain-containing protein [Streptomyces sp. TS71-3]GHJ36410.1 hypothetical protein Sm713_20190 [Streptomyces sp. TS71-3]GHJ39519.1 hypothetical protein Sm713_51280 [Streptomyces sp. TS71-3]